MDLKDIVLEIRKNELSLQNVLVKLEALREKIEAQVEHSQRDSQN